MWANIFFVSDWSKIYKYIQDSNSASECGVQIKYFLKLSYGIKINSGKLNSSKKLHNQTNALVGYLIASMLSGLWDKKKSLSHLINL